MSTRFTEDEGPNARAVLNCACPGTCQWAPRRSRSLLARSPSSAWGSHQVTADYHVGRQCLQQLRHGAGIRRGLNVPKRKAAILADEDCMLPLVEGQLHRDADLL
eukprot:CAMPEP_0171247302 /NCGR_PEP_ID=MMETSP0790-20130122/48425_1 /TAXON_ID=2925 /ORGANISM="Alexandrium catenella, Strain OF101" /LENGTH=104 /DNA_ID=CAMNT_0011714707 /DNA_START=12 /DNA_END=323 /DNA_ORIENTATION=+